MNGARCHDPCINRINMSQGIRSSVLEAFIAVVWTRQSGGGRGQGGSAKPIQTWGDCWGPIGLIMVSWTFKSKSCRKDGRFIPRQEG